MKRFVLFLLTTLTLVSCRTDSDAKYKKAHIQMEGGVPIHCQVIDVETLVNSTNQMLQIKTVEYGWVAVDSKNFILYQTDKCPICNK